MRDQPEAFAEHAWHVCIEGLAVSTYQEGTPTGSWGGKTHAVDPRTNHGRVVNVGTALCGQTVYIGRDTWSPVVNDIVKPGHCIRCVKAWRNVSTPEPDSPTS